MPTIEHPGLATRDILDRDAYLVRLVQESRSHRALNHPWLKTMSRAAFPDLGWALRDFAWNYRGYSAWFIHYLRAVIAQLDREDHRALLRENLAEEKGHLDEADREVLAEIGIDLRTVDSVPHPVLFDRFCKGMGISRAELGQPGPIVQRWRGRFRNFLEGASPAAGVGALGLGTEGIVVPMYEQILAGIEAYGRLERKDYVFFELHCRVDDQHQKDLLEIARDFAGSKQGRRDLRRGMLTALNLRCQVWDSLYRRAMSRAQVA